MRAACPRVSRPHVAETLARFIRQSADQGVVDVGRQAQFLIARSAVDLIALAFQVPGIFGLHFDLQFDLLAQALIACATAPPRVQRRVQIIEGNFRPAQQIDGMRLARQRARPVWRAMRHRPRRDARRRAPADRLRPPPRRVCAERIPSAHRSMSPSSRPAAVRRRSALSSRSESRYSARLVNMR